MDRRTSDLLVGALLALALHGVVLGAVQRWSRLRASQVSGVEDEPWTREQPVVVLDAQAARALIEPTIAPPTARLREAGAVPHAPHLAAPPAPELGALVGLPPLAGLDPLPRPRLAAAAPGRLERLVAPPVATIGASSSSPQEEVVEVLDGGAGADAGEPPDLEQVGALVLQRPPLVYPERAERRGVEGVVRVGLEVAPAGAVARAWLLRGSGSRALDRAALENVRAWIFDPAALRAADAGRVFRQDVRFSLR